MYSDRYSLQISKEVSKLSVRNSSVELFRIIAMLFVVIVHCNGWLVGGIPDDFDEHNISFFRISQAAIQAVTCTCVNMFILISGYFGLNLKWKSILNIYLLILSITVPFYFVDSYLTNSFSLRQLLSKFMAFSHSGYFVECYLLLLFFSPVFNAFFKAKGKRVVLWVLCFWAIEVYFEFVLHDSDLGFDNGYSFIHFALIYMIGRTISIYKDSLLLVKNSKYVVSYIFSTFVIWSFYLCFDMKSAFEYSSPFNIFATCCLFLLFAKKTYYNRWINWIASSTFAVYIIH